MSMPFYVAPEQFMRDKADFARKNIARGRPLVATVFTGGVLICAENTSKSLHKVSEIYDRIAFAGVGRYNEFDQLRRSGVQHADVKGYQFSREDVDARALANLYAQFIGNVFTHEMKPLEVEILVCEVGAEPSGDQLFHILYDGTVVDEDSYTVLGGEAEAIANRMAESFRRDWDLGQALRATAAALAGPDKEVTATGLEVAILVRHNGRRAFRRVEDTEMAALLADRPEPSEPPASDAAGRGGGPEAGGPPGDDAAPEPAPPPSPAPPPAPEAPWSPAGPESQA